LDYQTFGLSNPRTIEPSDYRAATIVTCRRGESEKCGMLERQKRSAERQLEVLTERLNAILGLLSVDTVSPSIDDIINKVCVFLTYCLVSG